MSKRHFSIIALFITLCFFMMPKYPSLANTLTVDTTGGQYTSIQEAINKAKTRGDVIIVAKGIYKENINFMGKAVTIRSIYGPFVTTIDGNFEGSVVTFDHGEDANSVLKGFTILNGQNDFGGGILCQSSDPNIVNCIITHNIAIDNGGGIYCHESNPVLVNCTITDNEAFGNVGGAGIFCSKSSPKITNCTISNNETYNSDGGGIYYENQSSPTITNSIIWGNKAAGDSNNYNLAINNNDQSTIESITVTYSDVQYAPLDALGGSGNINKDPLFLQKEFGNYYLKKNSPCIDKGTTIGAPLKDQKGINRPQGNKNDMGAYEIVLTDNEPPVPDVEGQLPTITAECAVTLTAYPTATDFYAGKVTGIPVLPDPNILLENNIISKQGDYLITWKYDDGQGHTSPQAQEIKVEDKTFPIPDEDPLPTIISYEEVTLPIPTATDNCLGTIEATTTDPTTYSEIGTHPIMWNYLDDHGNLTVQNQLVIIIPFINPNAIDPNAFDPNAFDPNAFDPNAFDPNAFDPNAFDPNAFDPNAINKIVYRARSGGSSCFISSLIDF